MERSKSIFGNELSTKDYKKALRTQKKSLRKFGDDRNRTYHLKEAPTPAIGQALGVRSLLPSAAPLGKLGGKSVIVGSIRMGFGTTAFQWQWRQPRALWATSLIGWIYALMMTRAAARSFLTKTTCTHSARAFRSALSCSTALSGSR